MFIESCNSDGVVTELIDRDSCKCLPGSHLPSAFRSPLDQFDANWVSHQRFSHKR
jgi:hypothetical protein